MISDKIKKSGQYDLQIYLTAMKEMEVVRWYMLVMEGGVDARDAVKKYAKVKDRADALEKELENFK